MLVECRHEGEIFGFLGPNGAGKTTTMRMLCCLIVATSGDAHIGGYDIANPEDSLPFPPCGALLPCWPSSTC
jgi:ABC-2 type transport system ATP-binding protein